MEKCKLWRSIFLIKFVVWIGDDGGYWKLLELLLNLLRVYSNIIGIIGFYCWIRRICR